MENQVEMPWKKEYKIFGIPDSFAPYPDRPVWDMLALAAKKYKKNGLIQTGYKLRYLEVKDQVDRLATALAALGLKKGDRVATLLPTSIQFVICDYAISRAGLVHIPSSSLEPLHTLEHKFTEGSPRVLIAQDTAEVARDVVENTDIEHLIWTRLSDYSDSPSTASPAAKGEFWLPELIRQYLPEPPELAYDVENDLETLLFTGGTTGLPKGCMLTHRNIYANAIQNFGVFGAAGRLIQGAVSVVLGLPFFHSYGHIVMHAMTIFGANQILIPDARDTDSMAAMIEAYNPVLQFGVPTQFMKMSQSGLKRKRGILGMSGSAPLPESTQQEFEKSAGGGIMEGYGLSEMSPVTHVNTSFLLRIFGGRIPVRINNMFLGIPGVTPTLNFFLRLMGSRVVGWMLGSGISLLVWLTKKSPSKGKTEKRGTAGIPYPDTVIRLVDVNTNQALDTEEMLAGHPGELCMKGPQRMLGYWPEPGSGLDNEGYVRTSDVVKIDERGYFYIVDRTKDMIIVSGYKVYSREIEDILYAHPKVAMAAAVGVPDAQREGSERVVVYLQPFEQYQDALTEKEVVDYLKERVAKYAVPRVVRIVNEIPLTEVQKVDKKRLRELAKREFSENRSAAAAGS